MPNKLMGHIGGSDEGPTHGVPCDPEMKRAMDGGGLHGDFATMNIMYVLV
jgi:hypothetical protein